MNTALETLKYFLTISLELTALFIGISTLIGIVLQYIPQAKIRKWMSSRGIWGVFMATVVGAITPFCACSTIPMAKGLMNAGVTFSAVLSFIIASPLLNPIILAMLLALVGWKACLIYFVLVFGLAMVFGLLFGKYGSNEEGLKASSCRCEADVQSEYLYTFGEKMHKAFWSAVGDYKAVFWYLIIGVGIGSLIYGYLPQDIVLRYAGGKSPFAVPIAAVIGIPLYIRTETAIPIGLALMGKGMSIGAVIALIIGGAGMAIPEMTMLASIFKRKTVAVIVFAVFLTAVVSGYVFNTIM
ncbi:permease [Candidatus Cloacimonadaceae bacterium]